MTGEYENVLDKASQLCDTAKRLIEALHFRISIYT